MENYDAAWGTNVVCVLPVLVNKDLLEWRNGPHTAENVQLNVLKTARFQFLCELKWSIYNVWFLVDVIVYLGHMCCAVELVSNKANNC